MKFTFLGTSSCEGMPALFCNCPRCVAARELKGKNIRTRAQALIDGELLLDFPPDTLYHFHQNGIEGHKIKYLLFTHSHADHFCPRELGNRGERRSVDLAVDVLHVYCTKGAIDKFAAVKYQPQFVQIHAIKPYDVFTLGHYRITALPAKHHPGDEAVNYLIEDGDKTLFYGLDTGYLYDEVFDYLAKNGVVLDMAVYDCSAVEKENGKDAFHMGIPEVRAVMARLRELGVVTAKTKQYVSHFSHFGHALQSDVEEMVKDDGLLVAFDGCALEV